MKIALVGYGKMGKLIDQLAPEFGIEVGPKLDEHNNANGEGFTKQNFQGVDTAIEFSTPHTVVGNIERLAELGINTVVGTTGWAKDFDRVKHTVEAANIGLVWSPNFSIGVQVFFRLVAEASRLLKDHPEYGAWAWEIHHDTKADAPSGTLLKLVDSMKGAGYTRNIDVSSNRAGRHPGTHDIGFDSPADTLTLRHAARSREGFARGALKAAEWISGKRGMYEFGETLFNKGVAHENV
jgi:4-hydroxy-tetrahydrodipicolinate reductase